MVKLGRKLIKSMNGKNYLVKRSASGSYVDGVWTDTTLKEVQLIEFDLVPDVGDFTLIYDGEETDLILFDATFEDVQEALRLLPGLSLATVEGDFSQGFRVNLIGVPDSPPAISIGDNNLNNGGNPVAVTVDIVEPFEPLQVLASVQPLTGLEVVRIPEGDRNRERKKLYSADLLYANDDRNGAAGDIISIDGFDFQVESVEPWTDYYKAIAVRVERGEA